MAEWLYEVGIGETRAVLVQRGDILEMAIEPDATELRVGAVCDARLLRHDGRWRVAIEGVGEADLEPPVAALTEGARLRVAITREAVAETDRRKLPRARIVDTATSLGEGPTLVERISASGLPVREVAAADGLLDAAGWTEALEEAASGIVARSDAMLHISLTPAMTLIDVDGAGPPAALAIAGARLGGTAIRRFGIAGSIGIDLPTCPARADRQAAAVALDAVLPQPFERTGVNGFGFLQIVRRRERPSLMELLAADPVGAAARALLRLGEQARGHGPLTLSASALVIERIAARPDWREALARRIGARVELRAEARLAISAGHAHRAQI